ncbi:hypothetical protein CRYUN_Cryun05aG0225000 [Craigia yunnanensis]
MMAQKHLHELLQEDQEPFLLKKYIADRRCQLKKPSSKTHIQIKKRKPISQNSNFPSNFYKNACLFSFHDSPDPRKSPLFEFPSPAKRPCKSPNAIFLHIPARTEALLLEAALRIQKQSSSKTKPQSKTNGSTFGLFGSILKSLTHRNRNRNRAIANEGAKVSVKDILRWDSTVGKNNLSPRKMSSAMEDKSGCEMGFSCSYNGRPSSAVWSESKEDKSLDMDLDTSCSCSCSQSEDFEEIFMSNEVLENKSAFASCDKHFCESPFNFVLQRSPSFGHGTPLFSSPVTSPSRHQKEVDKENYEVESLKKLQVEEEEEEKEQCSPVSVLDPPFKDDEDRHVDDDDENDGFDLECSYAIVQRTKQQLLHKLCRFEKLAELDLFELEKRMLEQEQDDDNDENGICDLVEEEKFQHKSASSDSEMNVDGFLQEVLKSSFHNLRHFPEDMKRLVSDLIAEQETEQNCYVDREVVAKRVCKRLDSWKEVESNTIDMMVEQDFGREIDGWKRNQEQIRETALEVEYAIFGLLMEELSEELV